MDLLFTIIAWLTGHVDVIQVIACISVTVNNTYKVSRKVWLDLTRRQRLEKKN